MVIIYCASFTVFYYVSVNLTKLSEMILNILEIYLLDAFINVYSFFWCIVYMYVNYTNLRFI